MNNQNMERTIEKLREKIKQYGNRTVWLNIEQIKDPIKRVHYRGLFFLADGELV